MRCGAIRLRLLAAGVLSILLALAIAAVGLYVLFERHAQRRIELELESDLRQLINSIERGPSGQLQVSRPLAEPRFSEPLSGLYWQVTPERPDPSLRSRSLWDSVLAMPAEEAGIGDVHSVVIAGPNGTTLFAVERTVVLPRTLGGDTIRAAVAMDRSELTTAAWAFISDLIPFLSVLAALLLAGGWLQVTVGLKPLDTVRARLADVRAGRRTQLGTGFPDEVRPLTAEVDLLLVAQDEAIRRARARAAELAHALLTPLTVLRGDAEELRAKGIIQIANEIAAVADGMRHYVERELARARAGAKTLGGSSHVVLPIVQGIVGVLSRLPAGRSIDFEIDVPNDFTVEVDPQDLTEMVGALGENATKWALGRVTIRAILESNCVVISVEDDGPGIPEAERVTALSRGGRLAQAHAGTGLGLAIVSDLCNVYGGVVNLARAGLGGLRVEIRLPVRQSDTPKADQEVAS